MNVTGGNRFSNIRDRSRSARERSRSLRVTSQQLRDSLENLRAYAAKVNGSFFEHHKSMPGSAAAEQPALPGRTSLEFAGTTWERVHKARAQARVLRRQAADLRNQATEFRARSENLRSNSARI